MQNFSLQIESIATQKMNAINPALTDKFATIFRYLVQYTTQKNDFYLEENVGKKAKQFADARQPKAPSPPQTMPDEMVSFILQEYFSIPQSQLERIKREHALSMGAENLVGDLLERYLASVLEPQGWIWCSGSIVKAVDFIKPPIAESNDWQVLQVKNRDNSENSSSSAIRSGTSIKKWFRSFSIKGGQNWADFPDIHAQIHLSEQGFHGFVENYLHQLRNGI